MLLIYAKEGSSVPDNVIQGIYEGAQLRQFNMVTHSENLSHLEIRRVIRILHTLIKCPSLLSNVVILLCGSAHPHKTQQSQNLLQNFGWETLHHPHTIQIWHPAIFMS